MESVRNKSHFTFSKSEVHLIRNDKDNVADVLKLVGEFQDVFSGVRQREEGASIRD